MSIKNNIDAPNFQELLPNFTPEFTLKEYKTVILLLGTYWGTLPGVLDSNSLAASALEADGWKVVVLWQAEVEADVFKALYTAMPELRTPSILGEPRYSPYGHSTYMITRRQWLAGQSFRKKLFFDPQSGSWQDGKRNARKRTRYRPTTRAWPAQRWHPCQPKAARPARPLAQSPVW